MTGAHRCAAACVALAVTGCVKHVNVVNVGRVEAGATVNIVQIHEGPRSEDPKSPPPPLRPIAPEPAPAPAPVAVPEAPPDPAPTTGPAGLEVNVLDCFDEDGRRSFNQRYAASSDESTIDARTKVFLDGARLFPGAGTTAGKHELRVERLGCATETADVSLVPGKNVIDVSLQKSFMERARRFDGPVAPVVTVNAALLSAQLPSSFQYAELERDDAGMPQPVGTYSSGGGSLGGASLGFAAWFSRFAGLGARLAYMRASDLASSRVDTLSGPGPAGSAFDVSYFSLLPTFGLRVPLFVYTSLEAHGDVGMHFISLSGRGFDAPGGQSALALGGGGKLRVAPACVASAAFGAEYLASPKMNSAPSLPSLLVFSVELAWHVVESDDCRIDRAGIRQEKKILE